MATKYGKVPVGWNEVWNQVGTRLPKESIIQHWIGHTTCGEVTENGNRCIYSPDGPWYLDGLKSTWESMYNIEVCSSSGVKDELCDGPG